MDLKSWPTSPAFSTARRVLGTVLMGLLGLLCAPIANAQGIESVLRPGDLIRGHDKWENECSQCHVKFDRNGQDRLCMDCHKDVGQDVRGKTGHHGRIKPDTCRSCHTDHKGRDARIVPLDKKQFDHALTDYPLRGKHAKVECDKCHEPSKKFRQAPQDCNTCHRKDDVHKGSLGAQCTDCHTESNWKEAKFDHGKTRFALTGKHMDVKCADCHRDNRYKETPRTCIGCHKKDDDSAKGHKGRFGERCDSCHSTKSWKPSSFNHDTDTKYVLRGKHRAAKCTDCHTGNLYREKLAGTCYDCHRKDDKHKESLGRECGACHTERDWKETGRFDHDRTRFALLGKHKDTACKDCHKSSNYKDVPSVCYSCHQKDDKHEATLGTQCQGCHVERDWKTISRFDHERTRFALRNAHAARKVQCKDCHVDLRHYRGTAMDCLSCHKKDDKHEGTLGARCEQCHDDRSWKNTRFDHGLTRFPLVGRHVKVECGDCHTTQRYKDAPSDCFSCHKKDDKHTLKFGTSCESCHNARSWGLWDFDHTKRAKYALDGAHAKLACQTCHTRPAAKGRAIADIGNTCLSCHRKDDTHDGAYGPVCEQCHFTDRWKRIRSRLNSSGRPAPEGAKPTGGLMPASLLGQASRLAQQTQIGGGP